MSGSPADLLAEMQSRIDAEGAPVPEDRASGTRQAVAFEVCGTGFLVGMHQVSEVLDTPAITRIPGVRSWVRGVANVRGVIFPVVDLGAFAGADPSAQNERSRLIAIDRDDLKLGLVVDRIIGMRQLNEQDMQPLDQEPLLKDCTAGLIDLNDQCWRVLDVDSLINSEKFTRHSAA